MSVGEPTVSLIVAAAENGVIGLGGGMPWHLPEDLKRFKALTMGKPMLMGRRTFESIGRPLPGRTSLVLTRSAEWARPGAVVVRSMEDAVRAARDAPELVVIGGAQVYELAMPYVRRIYLTRVLASVGGDTVFPTLEPDEWRESRREEHPADARQAYGTIFSVLERVADRRSQ
jgi:dihydrofolate reductase